MSTETFLDFLGVRLNGPKAEGKKIALNLKLTDTKERFALGVENATLHYSPDKQDPNADASLTLTRTSLNDIILGKSTLEDKIDAGEIQVRGNRKKVDEFVALLDDFELWFNIVTP